MSAVEGQPWIFIDQFKQPIKINIRSHYRVNSAILAKSAVLKGIGFAILVEYCCLDDISTGELQVIKFPQQPAPIDLIAIYTNRSQLSPIIEQFLTYLAQKI